jgi:hypothetical protein
MANMSYGVGGSSYFDLSKQGRVFGAQAIVTAPVIFSTALGTGGPFLYNPVGNPFCAVLLAVTCAATTVTTVAAALGITGNTQAAAPTVTTAIDSIGNLRIGGVASRMNVFRTATPSSAGSFFLPLAQLSTGALTVENFANGIIPLEGAVIVPPGSWASVSASATASTLVAQLGLIWAEVPPP